MDLMISEIQITCCILMGLVSICFFFVIPNYERAGKKYSIARKFLGCGTILISVHFFIQYLLQKQGLCNIHEVRSTINLFFGIPISYSFFASYLYLLRRGRIRKTEWAFGPLTYILSLACFLLLLPVGNAMISNFVMALLYASTLFYYGVLQLMEYRKIVNLINQGERLEMALLIRCTRWSLFLMTTIAFGFPLMTFNLNPFYRSIYGLLSISFAFFYIVSFIIYGFNLSEEEEIIDSKEKQSPDNDFVKLSEARIELIKKKVEQFIVAEHYLQPSLTMKEAADLMDISANQLKLWLRTTEYEKFNNWITSLRIHKAMELMLENPDANIENIADQCGFCDRPYFSRQFTKQVGISPSKWIKEANQK